MEAWLGLWTPELGKPHTAVLVRDVDLLPLWVAERLRDLVVAVPGPTPAGDVPFAVTAGRVRRRARSARQRSSTPSSPCRRCGSGARTSSRSPGTPRNGHADARSASPPPPRRRCADYGWPGNIRELQHVVREAATRTDVIDVRHLPADVLAGSSHRLTRIEAFERDEIVRVLSRPGIPMREAGRGARA